MSQPVEPAPTGPQPTEPEQSTVPTDPAEPLAPAEQPAQVEAVDPIEAEVPSEAAAPAAPAEPEPVVDDIAASPPDPLPAPPEPAELVAPLAPLPIAPPAPEADSAQPAPYADSAQPAPAGRSVFAAIFLPVFSAIVAAFAFLTALLLLNGFLTYQWLQARGPAPVEASRKAALDAGRDAARLVFSYDYRHLAKDFAAAEATTTGSFKKEYANTTQKLVSSVAPPHKAVLLADVSEAGIVSASTDRVLLLVFLDVQSTSDLAATPKITPRRLTMTMERHGDRWLIAKIDAF